MNKIAQQKITWVLAVWMGQGGGALQSPLDSLSEGPGRTPMTTSLVPLRGGMVADIYIDDYVDDHVDLRFCFFISWELDSGEGMQKLRARFRDISAYGQINSDFVL